MADMLIWIVSGGRKRRPAAEKQPGRLPPAYASPLVLSKNPSREQAIRLGQFALQFLH